MEKVAACLYKRPNAVCRLICFPWAGGETSELAQWGKLFSSSVEDILRYIQVLGGTPSVLLQNEDTKKHLILNFREDLRVLQTFSFDKSERNIPLSCDITFFNGSEGTQHDLEAWHYLTSGDTSFYNFSGGHFYLLERSNEIFLTKHMKRCIENSGL
ncbi:S-acyl fatty acid synthase thioesterase, medium chain [Phaethornis superciliosus]